MEVASPIYDADLRARILDMFDTMLRDNVQAREMESNGQYRRLKPAKDEAPLNSQEYFYQQAYDLAPKAGTTE